MMMTGTEGKTLVIGLGEIGQPLLDVLGRVYEAEGKDIEENPFDGPIAVMHICYPLVEQEAFVQTTLDYIERYDPGLVIVNSTVVPGTSAQIAARSGRPVAFSPVRGKHTRMAEELMNYKKFVAGCSADAIDAAVQHLEGAGMQTRVMSSCKTLELAKLLETTYFGVLIAWAQEMDRYADVLGVDYEEAMTFTDEIAYLPDMVFRPGFIGGHCIIPNMVLLDEVRASEFLKAVRWSNTLKEQEWREKGRDLDERLKPRKREPTSSGNVPISG
jgi:UDP-N-acetyl-D-mannosaminuronate dehydrogenase